MKLTEDEVIHILKLVEESTFDELHLETGDMKLVVRKKGCGVAVAGQTEQAEQRSMTTGPMPRPAVRPRAAEAPPHEPGRPAEKEAAARQEGLVPIKAPLLGTVYRRPSPDAPPYVEAGSFVKEDDTVCLIEVMKVFTAVKAGVRGQITEVLVQTNEMVEYGQPLFLVKPETAVA